MASLLKDNMPVKMVMEGTLNGQYFKCEGVGEGNPHEGVQIMKVTITEGGPLQFAYDILSPCSQYGSKTFIKHGAGIPDYFKQSFPEGFTWERTTIYEDGGYLTANQETSLEKGFLVYKVNVVGSNFPANGPVMQNKTLGWEPCVEMLYPRDGVLCGESLMALKCNDNSHLTCHLRTTYRSRKAAKALKMPEFHFGEHRITMTRKGENGRYYEQRETSVARDCQATYQ